MCKNVLVILSLVFWAVPAMAQDVDTAWVRRYNGPGHPGNSAEFLALDSSGNILVTGGSWRDGTAKDYATIKYYPDGDTAWVRRYNGPSDTADVANALAVDDSGNVYVTGRSYGIGTEKDYATIKYYSNGDTAWVRRYNGPGNHDDNAWSIAVDKSGNVYVTGASGGNGAVEDYATIKYYPDGDTAWVRRYNGPGNGHDIASALAVDDSGNVYVTGWSDGNGTEEDYATIKYYPNGDTAWVRRYDGPGNQEDAAWDIAVDLSGNVYVTGDSEGASVDFATIKYYPNGDTAWVRRYDGPESLDDGGYALAVHASGNVYVAGASDSSGSGADCVTVKYDQTGNELWVQRYNGQANHNDEASDIVVDDLGAVYVTGYSQQSSTHPYNDDYLTIKYYPNGDTAWVRTYNGPGNALDFAYALAIDGSGNVYVTGQSDGTGTYEFDYATIKYVQVASASEVGGHILADTTWTTAGSPYIVIDTVFVDSAVVLTIEPGVVVKFNEGLCLNVNGTLIARGTGTDSIRFRANTMYPTPGYWGSVHFFPSAVDVTLDTLGNYVSGCALEYCIVEYGGNIGGTGDDGAVRVEYSTILIRNCRVSQNLGWWAAGVYCLYSYSILDSNIIAENQVTAGGGQGHGGGIHCSYSSLTITNNIIENNSAPQWGGGIYCYWSAAVIEENLVRDNVGGWGSGIYCERSDAQIRNNEVTYNQNHVGTGGGIAVVHCSPEIRGNLIRGNVAYTAAAIQICDYSSPSVIDNIITENYATHAHGGIAAGGINCVESSPIIKGNVIVKNTSHGDAIGGAIACQNNSPATITNNIISQNSWGVTVSSSSPSLKANNIWDNDTLNVYITDQNWDVVSDSNWWSTYSTDTIDTYIWDMLDDITLGRVQYEPFLSYPLVGQPDSVLSVGLKTDSTYETDLVGFVEIGNNMYVKLVGIDTSRYSQDQTTVTAKSDTDTIGVHLILNESGDSTGVYRGVGHLGTESDQLRYTLAASSGDTVKIISNADSSKFATYIAFLRGDANGDGVIDLGDVLYLISYLYKGGLAPDPFEAGDCDCNSIIDLGDVLLLINYLYKAGPPPGC